MEINWAEKYRPSTLNDVKGNLKAVKELWKWANGWEKGRPLKQPAVILAGEPGTGKTSAALALGHDKGWSIIELNASDSRSYNTIYKTVTMGVTHDTFTDNGEYRQVKSGGRKLIILDEADNLYERKIGGKSSSGHDFSDKGGKKAIIEALSKAKQPMILIVNDAYALTKGRGMAIKRMCKNIKFGPVDKVSIKEALKAISIKEELKVPDNVINIIVDKANGDLRSAINDLQVISIGRKTISLGNIEVIGYRDPRTKIYAALKTIFKTKSITMARDAARNVDETPESMMLWIDENLPYEYTRTTDLITAYHYLSVADILLRRVYRRQHFGLWSYASELISGGVALSKRDINNSNIRYRFPTYLIKMSKTKGDRGLRDRIFRKLRNTFHCSTQGAREMIMTIRQLMLLDKILARKIIESMELEENELIYIVGNPDVANRLFEETEIIEAKGEEDIMQLHKYHDEEKEGVEKKDISKNIEHPIEPEDDEKESQTSLMDF